MSNFLQPHGLQHSRPPCSSPTPGVYPNSCPLSQWCHPTISSSVTPFPAYPQSFPASGSLQISQLFTSGGQSIGVSASASVLPMNTQDWSPLGWTSWISLQSKGRSRVSSNTTVQKHQFFSAELSSQSNSHLYMTTGKTITLTRQTFAYWHLNSIKSMGFDFLLKKFLSKILKPFLFLKRNILFSLTRTPTLFMTNQDTSFWNHILFTV